MSYTNIVKSVTSSIFHYDENIALSSRANVIKGTLVAGAVVSVGWVACKLTPIIWQQLKNLVSSRPEAQIIVDAVDIPRRTLDGYEYTDLYVALVKGYSSNLKRVARLLSQASEADRNMVIAKMIRVRNEDRETALHQAIRKGNASTINAFSNLLAMLPEDMRNANLYRVLQDTLLHLDHALESRSVGMIEAFISLVELLPCAERDNLLFHFLSATNEQNQTKLDIILAEGERNAIKSVASLVGLLSPKLCDLIILKLLDEENNNGEVKLHSLVRIRGESIVEGIASLLSLLCKNKFVDCSSMVIKLKYSAVIRLKENQTLENKSFVKSSEYLYSLFGYKKYIKVEYKILETKMVNA